MDKTRIYDGIPLGEAGGSGGCTFIWSQSRCFPNLIFHLVCCVHWDGEHGKETDYVMSLQTGQEEVFKKKKSSDKR